jgi:phosphoglycolate phosphatase
MEENAMAKLMAGDKIIDCSLVILDKNGTLIDQHTALLELVKAREKSVRKHVGAKLSELWEKAVGIDLKTETIDHGGPLATAPRKEEISVAATVFYLNGFTWTEAKRVADQAYDEADDSMEPPYGSVLFPGVKETLTRLKKHGVKLAVASTDTHRRTTESFRALGMNSLFDVIVGSDDVANGKPSPDMIIEIFKTVKSEPTEAVMVGDSTSDMQMGRNAKVKSCIGVLTGFTAREELEKTADVVIPSVTKLSVR